VSRPADPTADPASDGVASAAVADLRRRLDDLEQALDHAAIVATTDVSGRIESVNGRFCAISGYQHEELIGKTHAVVSSGTHPRSFWVELWRTIGAGRVWRGEICNRAKDGHLYWVDTTIVPFLDDDGRPHRYMAIRTDVSERKRAEARLRETTALTRLGTMASVVAHEVKNPLAGIGGALQVLQRRMPADAPERIVIGDILDRLGALNATMEDLLEYARPRPPLRRPLPLLRLARGLVDRVATDPRFEGVRVEATGDDLEVDADPAMIESVLLNLLLNAAQALAGRGHVRVEVERGQGEAHLRVIDDGPGVPAATLAQAFEPFVTTRARGTGLGLAIVQRVVEAHGGDVDLRCPREGGTVVSLRLPLRVSPSG
jgi:PAS domain S-box-containing protein